MTDEPQQGMETMANQASPEYLGRYLREFDRQLPGIDLRSALAAADASFEQSPDGDPEEDAREEADCWKDAA